MAFNPILNNEIQAGAAVDTALFTKVKNNFNDHEARLINEEINPDLVLASQILIADSTNVYNAENIEDALQEVMNLALNHSTILSSHGPSISSLEGRMTTAENSISNHESRINLVEAGVDNLNTLTATQATTITSLSNSNTVLGNRVTTAEGNITSLQTTVGNHETRITNAESSITSLNGLTSRMTTAENNIIALQNKTNTTFAGLTSSGGLTAVNLLNNTNFSLTLTENTTLQNPTNLAQGQSGQIIITQNNTTARTLAFGTYWLPTDGIVPTVSTTLGAVNLLTYFVVSPTQVWYALFKRGVA